jgi:hypothetical protein
MENIHLKQLKQLKHILATCLKMPETLENTVSPPAMAYLVGKCGGAGLPFLPMARGEWAQMQV